MSFRVEKRALLQAIRRMVFGAERKEPAVWRDSIPGMSH